MTARELTPEFWHWYDALPLSDQQYSLEHISIRVMSDTRVDVHYPGRAVRLVRIAGHIASLLYRIENEHVYYTAFYSNNGDRDYNCGIQVRAFATKLSEETITPIVRLV